LSKEFDYTGHPRLSMEVALPISLLVAKEHVNVGRDQAEIVLDSNFGLLTGGFGAASRRE
jgi:hypothetical protein